MNARSNGSAGHRPGRGTSRRRFLAGTAAIGTGAAFAVANMPANANADAVSGPHAGERQTPLTIYLAGDSTMQTYDSSYEPQEGWGQWFGQFFHTDATVDNRAIGGRSSRNFIEEGRLDEILGQIQPGDYLIVQFGHNDASIDNPDRYTSPEDFKMYLRDYYVAGARERDANPILATPVSRRDYDSATGLFNVSFPEYVDKVYELVNEDPTITMVDLSLLSREYLDSIGPEAAKDVFLWTDPGEYPNRPDGTQDDTHFQTYGAWQMARLVAQNVMDQGFPLADALLPAEEWPVVEPS